MIYQILYTERRGNAQQLLEGKLGRGYVVESF